MGVKYRVQRKSQEDFGVGPGWYNTDTNFYKNKGVTFTKAKQRLDKSSDAESSPGPDRYSTMTVKRIKGGRIGTSSRRKRNEVDSKDLPGPGYYESTSWFENLSKTVNSGTKAGVSFAKSLRLRTTNGSFHTPGPGRYSTNYYSIDSNIKKRTIGIKLKDKFNQTLPGPTDYFNKSTENIQGGTIGRSNRLLTACSEIEPSPHSYSPKLKAIKPRTPRFTFPWSRKEMQIENTPGPCQELKDDEKSQTISRSKLIYGTSSMLSKTKKSTFSLREGPGPARYSTYKDITKSWKPAYSFMNETRKSDNPVQKSELPGPGTYNWIINKKAVQNILFWKANRSILAETMHESPGPGSYNLRNDNYSKKHGNSKILTRLRKMFCTELRHNIKKKTKKKN